MSSMLLLLFALAQTPNGNGVGVVVVGGEGQSCREDPQCINRLHPACIPPSP